MREHFLDIGYIKSNGVDRSCLVVSRKIEDGKIQLIKSVWGKEADELFEQLTSFEKNKE